MGIMDNKELGKIAAGNMEKIGDLEVKTNEGNEAATIMLKVNKELQKKVNDTFGPICDKAHKAWKEAVAQRDKFLNPLKASEKIVKGKIGAFLLEQKRIADEKQRKLDEQREKEEKKEREKLEKKALKAEEKGDTEKAEAIREKKEEVFVPGAVVESTVKKVEGQSTHVSYDFKITNPNLVPRKYLVVDEKKIRQTVKMFGKDEAIPGVQIFPKVNVSIRS